MKNKLIVALVVLLAFAMVFAGCSSNNVDDTNPFISQDTSTDEDKPHGSQIPDDGKIVMPNSAEYYIGSEWTIETITEHFQELGFTNIRPVPCDPDDDQYELNIFEMVIKTGLFSTDPWKAGDSFDPDAEISIYYNEFPLLTIENCPDLVTVLTSTDMSYLSFCSKYDGRYVEFDAYVTSHITYDGGASHIISVAGGDFTEDGPTGLIIHIGNRTWGNLINTSVQEGDHVRVSGRVNESWAEYYKCLYVETLELSRR